jgi:predicted transcriptional regulator
LTKYRNKLQIVAEILEIVRDGARKTHIMYKCNLSYKLLKQYLKDVLRAELVYEDKDGNRYTITRKGEVFLSKFENYVERSEKVNRQVDKVNIERALLEGMVSGSRSLHSSESL